MTVSAAEQYLLEMINRARLDPQAEAERYGLSLNAGLASGTISGAPVQALIRATGLKRQDMNCAALGHGAKTLRGPAPPGPLTLPKLWKNTMKACIAAQVTG